MSTPTSEQTPIMATPAPKKAGDASKDADSKASGNSPMKASGSGPRPKEAGAPLDKPHPADSGPRPKTPDGDNAARLVENIEHPPATDPNSISDPSHLLEMLKNSVEAYKTQYEIALDTACQKILVTDKEKATWSDILLKAIVGVVIDVITEGAGELLFAGVAKLAGMGSSAAANAAPKIVTSDKGADHASAEEPGRELGKSTRSGITDESADALKEIANKKPDERQLQLALIDYRQDLATELNQRFRKAENAIIPSDKLLALPASDIRAAIAEVDRRTAEVNDLYTRGVMMGWMDLRARAATSGQPNQTTMMPTLDGVGKLPDDADGTDKAEHSIKREHVREMWNSEKISGFINIHFKMNSGNAADLMLTTVNITAEEAIIDTLKESDISLTDLPAPRRVFLDNPAVLATDVNPPADALFVATSTGEIELAPDSAYFLTRVAKDSGEKNTTPERGAQLIYNELQRHTSSPVRDLF